MPSVTDALKTPLTIISAVIGHLQAINVWPSVIGRTYVITILDGCLATADILLTVLWM